MSDNASALTARSVPSRLGMAAAVGGLVVATFVIGSVAPYAFKSGTLKSEIAKQIRATTGLIISSEGQARFGLLPEPHVSIHRVRFSDPSGTLAIETDAIDGIVRLLPLLVGRLEMSAATLYRPKLSIDFDGKRMPADSTIGRALRADDVPKTNTHQRLGVVTLVDGTAVLKGKGFGHPPSFDAINVTLDWRDLDSPATLTGSMKIQHTAADVAAWIARPSSLMRGDHSAVTLRVQSVPIDLSGNGDLTSGTTTSFRGHLSAAMPSLPGVFALGSYQLPLPAPFANVALNSDLTLSVDRDGQTIADLPSLRLRFDGNDYEGTLAFQDGAKPLLSGTLAADQLILTPFLYRAPRLIDDDRHWMRTHFSLDHIGKLGLDLRISATNLRLAPFTISDAALAIMTREHSTEIGLVEGKAYGGSLRGRLSFGAASDGLNVRAAGSLKDADVSSLSWDVFGRQLAAGSVSGSIDVETTGDSPAALMENLQGWAKARAGDGEISGVDLGRGLHDVARKKYDLVPSALRLGRTPFSALNLTLRLNDGVAALEQVEMQGQDARMDLIGKADVGGRLLNLHADVMPPSPPAASAEETPAMGFDISGSFDQITVKPTWPTPQQITPTKP